ncbi:MAG TPA: DUF3352 domain-containing protein, partial [Candidatus Omnitrophota bacterium]|nr:DUF3352 domain-containing protein [Candidatus Omnitrophota bacterium]
MKKIIVIALCVAIGIVAVGILLKTRTKGLAIESVLPQKPLVYVKLNDVEKNMKEISALPLGQALINADYDLLTRQNIITPQQGAFLQLIRTKMSEISTNPVMKQLFGREVAVAIYPLKQDMGELVEEMKILNPQLVSELLSGVFLVTRVDPNVQFAEFFTRYLTQLGAKVSQGQVEYKEETLRTIFISGDPMRLAFVRLDDLLVIGISEATIRESIDVYKQGSHSLAKDPQFAKIRSSFLDPSSTVGFLDFETFWTLLKKQIQDIAGLSAPGPEKDVIQKDLDDAFKRVDGFKTITMSSQLAQVIKVSSHVFFDPDELDAKYENFYTCPAKVNETINFVPQDVLGYQWSNCLDLSYYWEESKREMLQKGAPESALSEFEAKIGLSIEQDVLPAFGDELGGYISDIQTGGLFPIPKVLLFARVRDKSKAQQLLAKLQEQPIAIIQEETYKGIALKYLALPLGEALQPGYCFLGDYLLVATSRQLIKNSIDVSMGASSSLKADPGFNEVNFGLTDKNKSVQFVKIGEIADKIKGVIQWSSQWVAGRDQKAQAFESGVQKPLEEVEASIAVKIGELEQMRGQIVQREDEIWDLDVKGED